MNPVQAANGLANIANGNKVTRTLQSVKTGIPGATKRTAKELGKMFGAYTLAGAGTGAIASKVYSDNKKKAEQNEKQEIAVKAVNKAIEKRANEIIVNNCFEKIADFSMEDMLSEESKRKLMGAANKNNAVAIRGNTNLVAPNIAKSVPKKPISRVGLKAGAGLAALAAGAYGAKKLHDNVGFKMQKKNPNPLNEKEFGQYVALSRQIDENPKSLKEGQYETFLNLANRSSESYLKPHFYKKK